MRKLQSNQGVLNRVGKHMLKQNISSINEHDRSTCMYYGPNGLKCSIGCLIPRKLYDADLETRTIADDKIIRVLKKVINWDKVDCDILSSLQELHDHKEPEDWKDGLTKIAKQYNLKELSVV